MTAYDARAYAVPDRLIGRCYRCPAAPSTVVQVVGFDPQPAPRFRLVCDDDSRAWMPASRLVEAVQHGLLVEDGPDAEIASVRAAEVRRILRGYDALRRRRRGHVSDE